MSYLASPLHPITSTNTQKPAYLKFLGSLWVCIWLSTPLVGGIAVDLLFINGHNYTDLHPQGFSTLQFFRYLNSTDNLFKVIVDRGTIFAILFLALDIFQVRKPRDLKSAVPKVALAVALWYATVSGSEGLDLGVRLLGSVVFAAKFGRSVVGKW